ncbi:MAG: polyribonucleotide nucleotidyltransferase [Candidatus Omnitrophica bacterium]|nr:polyribonucleotide nucleotidyltransferase [Candidatus Omnitrophota bacterium]
MEPIRLETKINGNPLIIETGKLAKQADGAVTVQYGETVVLVTAVMSREIKEGADFLPLTVEYQEKTYAAGKIPGGFFKREGRPSEKEILTSRLIDRPIRPLFPDGLRNEIQIMAMVLSSDISNDPDILGIIGASSALHISDIPFLGPAGAVRVGRLNNEFIINPTYSELENSDLDLVVAGTKEGVVMLEGTARELPEELVQEAINFALPEIMKIIDLQDKLRDLCGRQKRTLELDKIDSSLLEMVRENSIENLREINMLSDREKRIEAIDSLVKEITVTLSKINPEYDEIKVRSALDKIEKEEVRKIIIKTKKRIDGRELTDIRPVKCEVGVLPRTHGSSLFTRGQTQSLAVTTLGTSTDEQMIDALEGETFKKFMLHYNFPPFSVGEVRPVRGPGRREIGHGALAERALLPVMPKEEEFPYTVRVVSDILESNGSSSMATVCGASLSLMDAGVPIKKAVSGIAMGLVKEATEEIVLTDIAGLEDHYGDMDFKIAGTEDGITAIQMDLKINGIGVGLISKILFQAKPARIFVLGKMKEVIGKPREKISSYAPKITTLKFPPDKIALIIGPGGRNIRKIIDETGVSIDIDDYGVVSVSSIDENNLNRAIEMINFLTQELKVGEIYKGKITRVTNFGAFCELAPGKEGLIHISELSNKFVKDVTDIVKAGEDVRVKVIGIDEQGRISLSIKQASPLDKKESPKEKS